ncbi:kinase-like domain-containing protein [Mycena metata]|uniref:Kinase-like domain-containing protein n=1 Tax=Mycena metata TaxID=1033252 RepID=A0AAD7KIL0_9AGAR|nr:kinase-like domain-containing protein [Mycena metata]
MSSFRKALKPLPKFEIGEDYEILHAIGEGAYGTVAAALHKPSGRQVAIKKILPFDHTLFALRTLRELKLLKFFTETYLNENIISILDIIKPPTLESFTEIYFIQELMQTDLHRVIRTQHLTDDHCQRELTCSQYFVYQTLRALNSIRSADIVHRDLKPANLLLNANCDLKVCDFGLARSVKTSATGGKEAGLMTEYVATRWYRAPEIMLSFKMYTKAIDIWAVGCVLAELLSGRPLFPGRDYSHLLDLILDVIGTPSLDEFYAITSRRSRYYIRALPIRKRRAFPTHHDPEDEPTFVPLSPSYFQFDSARFIPLLRALRLTHFVFAVEKENLSKAQLKELLYEEVLSFVPSF